MKTKKEILQENIEDIIKLRDSGMYLKDIAKIYGVSETTIGRSLKEVGITTRKELTNEDVQEIIKLYQDGVNIADIGKKFHKTGNNISQILKSNNIKVLMSAQKHRKYTINEHYFDIIDTQEKAYVIGLLMADGCIGNGKIQISLQEEDKHILEDIRDCMGSNARLYYIDNTKRSERDPNGYTYKNMYNLNISNKYMAEKLISLGVTERKSLTLQYPKWLKDEYFPSLIRGYMDGDGHINKYRNMISIIGTNDFLLKVQEKILLILGIKCRVALLKRNKITSELTITNYNDVKKFLDYIYKDSTIHLKRKYKIYLQRYINNTKVA